jgi:ubiquinone/menaquinone biosynthesis C-methylase UbiE
VIDLKEQEYWNGVSSKLKPDPTAGKFRDNFRKRKLLIRELLKYDFENQKVLEIGPGFGYTSYVVGTLNTPIAYVGLDVSSEFAKCAKELFGLTVQVGDASNIPFDDNTFDNLFAFDSMEHIHPDKRLKTFQEIDRVLKKDGRSIFINNPLNESRHDKSYDFGFNGKDIALLAETTKTIIFEVKVIGYGGLAYQFIVLTDMRRKG